MKKLITIAMMLACGFGFVSQSYAAERSAPLWVCQLGFKGTAKGFKIILGKYTFRANGMLNCTSAIGDTAHYPVTLEMNAAPISPGIAIGKYTVYGQSADISLFNTDPDVILGRYLVAQSHATLIGGVGVITAVKVGAPQLSITLSLNMTRGFGFDVSVNQLRILPREGYRYGKVEPE